jgi:hypothetical protein
MTFIDLCLTGKAQATDIDQYVDQWHNAEGGSLELHEFLGMTFEEYSMWATKPSVLPEILSARGKHDLTQIALDNKVASISHLSFHLPKICEMVEAAARDKIQGINAPKSNPALPIYNESPTIVNQSGIEKQLAFLLAHGFSPECIYSQAGKPC